MVNAPIESCWDFVKVMDNWAPFIKGYSKHKEISDRESIWTIIGDVGVLSRTVDLRVNITEWVEPSKVTFKLEGINERVTGKGLFLQEKSDTSKTKLTFKLQIKAGGLLAPVYNLAMTPLLRPMATEMADKIGAAVEARQKG